MASLAQLERKRAQLKCFARKLRRDEKLPPDLFQSTGFAQFDSINEDYCWVIESSGEIVAAILGMNGHGMFFILRMVAASHPPHGWAMVLLRKVFSDLRDRGITVYTTFLMPDISPAEAKLARIVVRAGGMLVPTSGIWAVGSTDTKSKGGR